MSAGKEKIPFGYAKGSSQKDDGLGYAYDDIKLLVKSFSHELRKRRSVSRLQESGPAAGFGEKLRSLMERAHFMLLEKRAKQQGDIFDVSCDFSSKAGLSAIIVAPRATTEDSHFSLRAIEEDGDEMVLIEYGSSGVQKQVSVTNWREEVFFSRVFSECLEEFFALHSQGNERFAEPSLAMGRELSSIPGEDNAASEYFAPIVIEGDFECDEVSGAAPYRGSSLEVDPERLKLSNRAGLSQRSYSQYPVLSGRYELLERLGFGGMGTVYRARDLVLGEDELAVKILHRDFSDDVCYLRRFLREVQLMRRVGHEHVVRTFDVGMDRDSVYYTMEYVDGSSLEDSLPPAGYSLNTAITLFSCLVEGLEAIHGKGIIHRDLKSANLLISCAGILKISDFGLARPLCSNFTTHREIMGSCAYMAPEIWYGEEPSQSVDLYALGVILFELCSGHLPFEKDDPIHLMKCHLDQEPPRLSSFRPEIPEWLENLAAGLLAKAAALRPKSILEVKQVIERERCKHELAP